VRVPCEVRQNIAPLNWIIILQGNEPSSTYGQNGEHSSVEAALQAALSRVSVVRCAHTFEVAAAYDVLNSALANRHDTTLVVIDSLATFHFRDKYTEAGAGEGVTAASLAQRNLSRLVQNRACLVLAAKPALFKPRGMQHIT